MIDLTKYVNKYTPANFETELALHDVWANQNDFIAQEFEKDMIEFLTSKLENVDVSKIEKIVDLSYWHCDTYEDRYNFCLELLDLLK